MIKKSIHYQVEWFLIFILKNLFQSYIIIWNQTFGSILYLTKNLVTWTDSEHLYTVNFDNLFIVWKADIHL